MCYWISWTEAIYHHRQSERIILPAEVIYAQFLLLPWIQSHPPQGEQSPAFGV